MALSAASKARARTVLWGSVAYIALAALACAFAACESSTAGGGPGAAPTGFGNGKDAAIGTQPSEGDSGTIGNLFNDAGLAPEDGGVFADAFTIPENFVPTELGGYALGPPVNGDGSDAGFVQSGNTNCSLVVGVVRDFLSYGLQDGGDPDFETFQGGGPTLGLVKTAIGTDRKPVYNNECDLSGVPNPPCLYGQQMTNATNFNEWYRFTANVNDPYLVYLEFVPNPATPGIYTFQSTAFFPLDNAGFGNTPGFGHNFSFTTELHLQFTYKGGETFSFTGDDDLWVFINGTLAIDLGGLHEPVTQAVSLDNLGLTKGQSYAIELFNAERHSTGSNFRVDTNLAFTSCGSVPPDVPK